MKRAIAILAWSALSCGAPPSPPPPLPAPPPVTTTPPEPEPIADDTDPALRHQIDTTLSRLSQARKLEVKRVVKGKRLGRDAVIELIMAKTQRELPPGVLEAQGELLRAFELIPADYDFVGGIYTLLRNNIAGFYEQHGETMYLLDDLNQAGDEETLIHELQHALQDQHWNLKRMLEYRPGDTDRVTAAHALCEGDALMATFEVIGGNAGMISDSMLKVAMVASVAMAEGSANTPRVLQAALVAPYIDGFRFVRNMRQTGGWKAVDAAFAKLPTTTEQLLHVDKYLSREPALPVREPPLPGSGWKKADADVLGEQGLRMVFEQWANNDEAAEAAAGWGGDRYLVARRGDESAVSWVIRFDDEGEAKQAEALIGVAFNLPCAERDRLGPIAWRRAGDTIALVSGPGRGKCAAAVEWLDAVLPTR